MNQSFITKSLVQTETVGDVVETEDRHVEEGQSKSGVSRRMTHVRKPAGKAIFYPAPDVFWEGAWVALRGLVILICFFDSCFLPLKIF